MRWLGRSRKLVNRAVPLVSIGIVACATSPAPEGDFDDGTPSGGAPDAGRGAVAGHPPVAGAAIGGAIPLAGRSGGGAGGAAAGSMSSSGRSSEAGSAGKATGGSGGSASGGSAGKAAGGSVGSASGGSAGKAAGGSAGKASGGSAGQSGSPGEAGARANGGTGGGASSGCDATSATVKATHSKAVDVKSDACIALVINPTWSSVNATIEGQPGTMGYPIPYSFSICNGKSGKGELTADYQKESIFEGTNPSCDIYLQFEGTGTTIKLMYYD